VDSTGSGGEQRAGDAEGIAHPQAELEVQLASEGELQERVMGDPSSHPSSRSDDPSDDVLRQQIVDPFVGRIDGKRCHRNIIRAHEPIT
jgi:hypothetical protein